MRTFTARMRAAVVALLLLFGAVSAQAANTPPVISGTPPTDVTVGQTYLFQPTASDAEKSRLRFSISGNDRYIF